MNERDKRILAMATTKSNGMIANELEVSRSVVSGVIFRNRYSQKDRGPKNTVGWGNQGPGKWAKEHYKTGPKTGEQLDGQ
jgi:hypothetical protein